MEKKPKTYIYIYTYRYIYIYCIFLGFIFEEDVIRKSIPK